MASFEIYVAYAIENNRAQPRMVSIDPAATDGTTVDLKGDITVGENDTADVHFRSMTGGWTVTQVQIRDKGTEWGTRLSDATAADYPGVDRDTGVLLADQHGNAELVDANKQASDIDYRVSFTDGHGTVITDPKIKDRGNTNR